MGAEPVSTPPGEATVTVDAHQLIKSLRWYDGFVVCLANPGFLISALGGAIALGASGMGMASLSGAVEEDAWITAVR